jgi:hypothetical protein
MIRSPGRFLVDEDGCDVDPGEVRNSFSLEELSDNSSVGLKK